MDKVTGSLWYVKWFTLVFLCALMVDIVYVFWPWPTVRGVAVFQHNLLSETVLVASLSTPQGEALIQQVQGWVYQPTFVWSGLHDFLMLGINPIADSGTASSSDIGQGLATGFRDQIQTAYIGVLLFAQRLAVLAMAAPLFGIVMLAAGADGFVSWYKRRTSVGRESGLLYHLGKHGFNNTLRGIWVLYLLPPIVIDPRWVIPPALLLVALATRLAVGYFKKYI
jgi:integrating conjugative element membrane protein (TIGR03747 family)